MIRVSTLWRGVTFWALFPAWLLGEDPEIHVLKNAVESIQESVVQIQTVGGLESVDGVLVSQAPSTGLIVASEGFILSSAFNFIQEPSSILVRLANGRQLAARVVARDRLRMLVLLKVDTNGSLVVPPLVPRSEIRSGQWAIAVGRSLSPDQPNVSVGIVSATNRIWGRAIQTDAKVSPLNYGGPLIDVRGRVLGILVPLSADDDAEVAGAELYDSGIGFAVPLDDLIPEQLERMKQGEDLKPGLIGINLKGQNIYTDPAIVGLCPAKTPGREAGMQLGDEIIAVDDLTISRQVHLKHALGRKMAGDTVRLRVRRGDAELEFDVTLTDRVLPYILPFLGILPSRQEDPAGGVTVAYLYPDSPAAEMGIQPNDRLVSLNGKSLTESREWREQIAQFEPGQEVPMTWKRQGEERQGRLRLASSPDQLPKEIPVRSWRQPVEVAADSAGHWSPRRLPDEPNECWVWDPDLPGARCGIFVWLAAPGAIDRDALQAIWSTPCRERSTLLMLPRPRDESGWDASSLDVIRRFLEAVMDDDPVDPHRIAVGGYQTGGSVAYAFAFEHRERTRGVAAVDAILPARLQLRGNDPESRLEFLQIVQGDSARAKGMQKDNERLREMKFPVIQVSQPQESQTPDKESAATILRWLDSLDRL